METRNVREKDGESPGSYVLRSRLVIWGMVIHLYPLVKGNPYNGYIDPHYWVDDHPLLYGNDGSLDTSTYVKFWYLGMAP